MVWSCGSQEHLLRLPLSLMQVACSTMADFSSPMAKLQARATEKRDSVVSDIMAILRISRNRILVILEAPTVRAVLLEGLTKKNRQTGLGPPIKGALCRDQGRVGLPILLYMGSARYG